MELISRPILTDPSRFGTEISKPEFLGAFVNSIVSPYDVPDSISVFCDFASCKKGVRLTYIVGEITCTTRLNGVLLVEIGKKSGRIFSLEVDSVPNGASMLSEELLNGLSRFEEMDASIPKKQHARLNRLGVNYRLVKRILKSKASQIDALIQELQQ